MRQCLIWLLGVVLLAGLAGAQEAAAPPAPQVWVRITPLKPADAPWRVQIVSHLPRGKSHSLYVGETADADGKNVQPRAAGQPSAWVELTPMVQDVASVRFLFEKQTGVEAKFDFATANRDDAIVCSVTEHDPGSVIAFRIPANLVKDKSWLLSIREDTVRRLNEIKAFNLPDGPRPRKIICMTGFRSNGQFYTDPAIAQMDFDIIRILGMNGYWEQGGGQRGELRRYCKERGIDVSTVYPRQVASPPSDSAVGGVRLDWKKLTEWIDATYRGPWAGSPDNPHGVPRVIADLMDEPGGITFAGPEYQAEFRAYLQAQGFAPAFFGKKTWEEIETPAFNWWQYFKLREPVLKDDSPEARRLFFWQVRFWNDCTAKMYAMATEKVLARDPNVIGTRVNFGPPWWYDYGSLPRGIDAFKFGELRSVSLGFNEDWIGSGNPRWPLEINAYLRDMERAAIRPQGDVPHGCYITRDADRRTVKLRTFGCLARETKIFDFYYYGPSYTFFDHWSDNSSMVQGVAELTRDMGKVDDLLYAGKAPKAEVALLYSRSWPVWKPDDTEQNELIMAHLALLHAGIPADIVSDAEVADGRFAARQYKALYVVNESIPVAAQQAILQWVRDGGRLWTAGWAGMRDEYNSPSARWDEMLDTKGRAWTAIGDLSRKDELIRPDDWKRPVVGRVTTGFTALRQRYGKGHVQIVPFGAGKHYMDAASEINGTLTKAIVYPAAMRAIYADFALEAGAGQPAVTSVSQLLAWPLWSDKGGVVLLANFTGNPAASVTVRFQSPKRVRALESLHHGKVKVKRAGSYYECTLPMPDVTDILVVK